MNYSKVQFLSWEVYTGPDQSNGYVGLNINPNSQDKRLDVYSQCLDIEARVLFTKDAISKAYSKASTDANTLKIFMGPEFLYRGLGGAYVHDLINGWETTSPFITIQAPFNKKWRGLFGSLQDFVADDKFKDWVFVFGTAVSASFKTELKNKIYEIDTSQKAEGYNTSLIQLGGSSNKNINYASRKHYKSPIDFIRFMPNYKAHQKGNIRPFDSRTQIPNDVLGSTEGAASFTLANVNIANGSPLVFGIEICLDHAQSTTLTGMNQPFGRLRASNQYVKIQMVPSGGMSLTEDSIRLTPASGPTPNSYAFNCDGLANIAMNQYGSHTQIWNGSNGTPVPPTNKLVEVDGGAILNNTQIKTQVVAIANSITSPIFLQANNLLDTQLWEKGAGFVRIVSPLNL